MRIQVYPASCLLLLCLLPLAAGCSNERTNDGRVANLEVAAALRQELFSEQQAQETEAAPDLTPQDYVNFTGTVVLEGTPPPSGTLNVTKDISICLPGGGSLSDFAIEVHPATKGLKNVLIYADRVPETWVHESALGDESERVFDQEECIFLDHIFALSTTQKLLIKNSDPIGHNTKFEPRGNPAVNVTLAGGDVYTYDPRTATASPFEVTCSVHPWMKAYMIFRDNAYYAVTDENGKFTIANVPTGVPLQWKLWHQSAPSLKTVQLGGEQVKLSRGTLERTFPAGQPVDLQLTIAAEELR